MRKTFRALLAGALVGIGAATVAGCLTPAERRALSVTDCVAQLALGLPDRELSWHPSELTSDDLALAVAVVDGVRACRRLAAPVAAAPAPDGGP